MATRENVILYNYLKYFFFTILDIYTDISLDEIIFIVD